MKRLTLILFIFLPISFANSYIYYMDVWTDGTRNYYILSDCHMSFNENQAVCNQQRYDIIKWATLLDASTVVEDIDENEDMLFNFDSVAKYRSLKFTNFLSPLTYITQLFQDANIAVSNVEFRICVSYSFGNTFRISASKCYELINSMITQIKNYNDSEQLNLIYNTFLSDYEVFQKKYKVALDFIDRSALSFGDIFEIVNIEEPYLQQLRVSLDEIHATEYLEILNNMELKNMLSTIVVDKYFKINRKSNIMHIFDLCNIILDLKLLHEMHNQRYTNIIVATGGFHANKISNVLRTLGYTSLYSAGDRQLQPNPDFLRDYDKFSHRLPYPLNLNFAFKQVVKFRLPDLVLNTAKRKIKMRHQTVYIKK